MIGFPAQKLRQDGRFFLANKRLEVTELHNLEIKNGQIALDDFQLQEVASYKLEQSAERAGVAELTLKLYVHGGINATLGSRNRPVEYIGLSEEQKAVLSKGITKILTEGNTDDMIGKQNHILNI